MSFEEKKFVKFKSNLSICSFTNCAFGVRSKKPLPNSESQKFSFIFFYKLYSNFRFYIYVCHHFWVNFWIWYDIWIKVHIFVCGYPVLPPPCIEKCLFFLHSITFALCKKPVVFMYVGLSGLCILLHLSICLFHTNRLFWLL